MKIYAPKVIPIKAFQDNYIWLIAQGNKTIVIDPGEATNVIQTLVDLQLELQAILITHFHYDHIDGIAPILKKFPDTLTVMPKHPGAPAARNSHLVSDQEVFKAGELEFVAIATPGHASEHIALYNKQHGLLFAGDCLFPMGCGRLFVKGNEKIMLASLNKLKELPDNTQIFSGHEYTKKNLRFALSLTSQMSQISQASEEVKLQARASIINKQQITMPVLMSEEKQTNPFLQCDHSKWQTKWQEILNLPNDPINSLSIFTELRSRRNLF